MKKSNLKPWIFQAINLLLFLFVGIFVIVNAFIPKTPSPNEVFKESQYSVVELKVQTEDNIVAYGTAVFIEEAGMLVSNAHMVSYKYSGIYREYDSFEIRFSFETYYRKASLIKYNLIRDISILKLDSISNAKNRKIIIGDSSKINSGDIVYAIGNGMNHGIGITKGIVSLPQVNITYDGNIRNVIQSDLIINEGNSGGALLDEKGKLIGITTFRTKDNSGNIIYGIAYAIPVNIVIEYINS